MRSAVEPYEREGRVSICVRHTARGRWEVALGDGRGAATYESLDEALRSADAIRARYRRCEMIVRDAYGRVMRHELLFGRMAPRAGVGAGRG